MFNNSQTYSDIWQLCLNRIKERTYQIAFPEESVRDHIAERHQEEMIEKVMRGQGNGQKKKNEHV